MLLIGLTYPELKDKNLYMGNELKIIMDIYGVLTVNFCYVKYLEEYYSRDNKITKKKKLVLKNVIIDQIPRECFSPLVY